MHKEKWGEYSDLSGKDKGTFFSGQSHFIYANTLDAHMDVDTGALLSWLDKAIVSDVIGGMLFDPAESEEKREKALSIFERVHDGPGDKGDKKLIMKSFCPLSFS
jgi:hypothetical protein